MVANGGRNTHTYRHANTERGRDRKNKQRKKVFLSTELEKVDIEGDGHVIHWLAAIGRFVFFSFLFFFFVVVRYCMCHHHNEDHHIASISVLAIISFITLSSISSLLTH